MKLAHLALALTVPLLLLPAACSDTTTSDPGFELVESALERDLNPAVSPADLASAVAGNTAFALDLHQQLASGSDNLFYSPHSVSVALGMTWAGARAETAAQMATALHFDLPAAQLHPALDALDLALSSRGKDAKGVDGEPFRLAINNSIWGQQGSAFEADFLDTLKLYYGAGLGALDFMADPEAARLTINEWVAEQTEDRIPDLLPQGSINSDVRLVLTNAIYFNASWNVPFEEEDTADAEFTLLDGSKVSVPTMTQTEEHRLAEGANWTAVELPYDGEEVAMTLLIPDAGAFEAVEGALDSALLAEVVAGLESTNVEVFLPRFEVRTRSPLAGPLKALGMVDAFTEGVADLSGIDGTKSLFVMDVLHEGWVKVNEAGTEAAAATAVIIGTTSAPPPPIEVRIDRPFLFFVRDLQTGAILFIGRIMDPSKGA